MSILLQSSSGLIELTSSISGATVILGTIITILNSNKAKSAASDAKISAMTTLTRVDKLSEEVDELKTVIKDSVIIREFNTIIDTKVSNALSYIEKDDVLSSFITYEGEITKEFVDGVLSIGLDKISVKQLEGIYKNCGDKIKQAYQRFEDDDFISFVRPSIIKVALGYLNDIKNIIKDTFHNNRIDKFRTITDYFIYQQIQLIMVERGKWQGKYIK